MFDLEKVYELTIDQERVHPAFWKAISHLRPDLGNPKLVAMVGNEYTNSDGKMSARLPRIAWREFDIDLDNWAKEDIGNLLGSYTLQRGVYRWSISDNMDVWHEGDQNVLARNTDTGNSSCFRPDGGMHNHWIAMNEDMSFFAVRFFDAAGTTVARAWLAASGEGSLYWRGKGNYMEEIDEAICLFNGYGMQYRDQALIIAETLGLNVRFYSVYDSPLYINSGACAIISPLDLPRDTTVRIRTELNPDDIHFCRGCSQPFDNYELDHNDYCPGCQEEYYELCPACEEYCEPGAINTIFMEDGSHYEGCDQCLSEYYLCHRCSETHSRVQRPFRNSFVDYYHVCQECHNLLTHRYDHCAFCDAPRDEAEPMTAARIRHNDEDPLHGGMLCPDCLSDARYCPHCFTYYQGDGGCPRCY